MNRHNFGQYIVAAVLFLGTVATVVYLPPYSSSVEHDRLEQRARQVASGLLDQFGSELFDQNAAVDGAVLSAISLHENSVSVAVLDESDEYRLLASTLSGSTEQSVISTMYTTVESDSSLTVTIPSGDNYIVIGIGRQASIRVVIFWKLVSYGAGALLFLLSLNTLFTGIRSGRLARSQKKKVSDILKDARNEMKEKDQEHREQLHALQAQSLQSSVRPRSSEDRQPATDTTTDTIQESADADTTGEPSLESGERIPIDIRGAADHQNRNEYDLSLAEGGGLHNSIKSHPVLSRYSKRLEALNELSVSTLKGINQEIIVSMALTHLAELITFDFARVIEYDVWKGEGRPLGIHTDSDLKILDYTHKPITYFRGDENVDRFQRYVSDLESLPNPSELDRDLLSAGLRSYFRQALQLGNEVIGTLTVASRQKDAFTLEEMKIARDIVDLISLAVSQSRNNSERDRYEAELISAKNRAEEMARVKTAFLSNMSHEVRTPLSGIIGFAQIMRSELEGEMGEFASLIYDGGTRLLETINSVLDFAKLEAGQLSMVATPTDVNETIRETIKLLTGLAEKKNLPITQDLLDGPLYCTLDRSSLERILNNLIGNAIKFTEEGYIEVSTELTGEFGRIVISDTGPGISEEFMPNLFNEFYQEEMGNDRKHGGSGLGLAITRRLVDKMGGWIEVDNREIRGTTFAITFPITSMEESGINNGKVNSVLVVSGSDTINHLDYAALQHDMDVQTVPDLKVAVQHARHRRFDMVVVKMDHQDTEIEMERVRAVREIPEYDKVPFIALSDEPFSEMEQRMLAREFDGFSQSAEGLAGYLFRLQERNQQISESESEAASDAGAKQQSDDVQDHFPLWEDES